MPQPYRNLTDRQTEKNAASVLHRGMAAKSGAHGAPLLVMGYWDGASAGEILKN